MKPWKYPSIRGGSFEDVAKLLKKRGRRRVIVSCKKGVVKGAAVDVAAWLEKQAELERVKGGNSEVERLQGGFQRK